MNPKSYFKSFPVIFNVIKKKNIDSRLKSDQIFNEIDELELIKGSNLCSEFSDIKKLQTIL